MVINNIMRKLSLNIFVFLFMASLAGHAEEVAFSASAPSSVGVGERFRLTFTLNTRPEHFEAPAFDGFRVLSGPSQSSSTSTQIINNQVTTTVSFSYTYVLEAREKGDFHIPPATVKVDGKDYSTEPVQITVSASVSPDPQRTPPEAQEETGEKSKPAAEDIFIRAVASNPNPYLGEQCIISYKLYTRLPVTNYSIERLPGFQGLWAENITSSGQPEVATEVVNGTTYNVLEIRRVAVFPQRTGKIRIDPMAVEMAVRMPARRPQRPGSLFDEFFGGSPFDRFQTVSHLEQSNAITLNVMPLPLTTRPEDFSGIVGEYHLEARLSTAEMAVNDAANLVITIDGRGNLYMVDPPDIQFPQHLDVFDPQRSDNIRTGSEGISGHREFDYVIIPRSGGMAEIPSIKFSYFDPRREEYITRTAGPFQVYVYGDYLTDDTSQGMRAEDRYMADDIRFIHTHTVSWQPSGKLFFKSTAFYILLGIPVILLLLFLAIWKKHLHTIEDKAAMRTRKARKVARKRLQKAAVMQKQGKKEAFFDEIFRTLWGYVSDRLNMPVSQLSKENVAAAFRERQVSDDLARNFLDGLQECEFARFAPKGMESPMEVTYNKALETIVTLENELRNQQRTLKT